ncbi:fused MFS/spermidine synthase [Defluviimonas aestuarii]|uniref:spermidine synthase n=1 Tax=Albidovulum aestuarii TaxID=1130726 RepID=UPI00249B5F6A|nr:fused MFS/spermidine synthase [Defluviimonas aestuarii]MDI3337724.1 fused MFS/spermidine synthase [Defluviimonas aestuarii]
MFVPVVFTATIFLSASLLFFVQPLFAKVVLPQIGGAPAVWTTAMLFFQSVLIGGYLYSHLSTRYLGTRAQVALHLALWALALWFLPLSIPEGWTYDAETSVAWQTLVLFGVGVGVPFGVLSANAPLIQAWYARSDGPSADDPYFLYGASNLGSLAALLAFPLVAEPLFGATRIGQGWAIGFLALGGFLLVSGLCAARGGSEARPVLAAASDEAPVPLTQIGHWLLLAFVPSSMMLAVTTKISTDLGAIPLIWVVPLSLYLLSFVLTFSRRNYTTTGGLRWAYLIALGWLGAVFSGITGPHTNFYGIAGLVVAFFVVAVFAHRRLYESRPAGAHLTLFYVVMSVGGALGGLFNSIVAPVAFDSLAEGGVTTLVATTLILSAAMRPTWTTARTGILVGLAGVVPLMIALLVMGIDNRPLLKAVVYASAAVAALALRRSMSSAAIAALIIAGTGTYAVPDGALFQGRSFFGTHGVNEFGTMRQYTNGTTIHGVQRLSQYGDMRPDPLFYYHENAPMAQVLTSDIGDAARKIGVVGLGVGSLACYRQPGQEWQFYEIDHLVDDIARNPAYFTFMSNCAGDTPTNFGDARMVLARQDGLQYDILVIDAYGSDAVPIHLTTHEAMQVYLDRLAPDGVLLYHISNRYYAIQRPLARSAEALGLVARIQEYPGNPKQDPGDIPSRVVMLSRSEAALGAIADDARWVPLMSDGGRIWTDDYANLLSVLE